MDISLKDIGVLDFGADDKGFLAKSDGFEVRVWPEFVTSQQNEAGDLFVWSYRVRIANNSESAAKLLNRHWRIVDENGVVQEVNGEGVIGKQPEIAVGEAFEYSSGVHLTSCCGVMGGRYEMIRGDEVFDVEIPTFSLSSPFENKVVN